MVKTKEQSRQIRRKVGEKFKAGLGYNAISQALKISQSNVQFRIWNSNLHNCRPTTIFNFLLNCEVKR